MLVIEKNIPIPPHAGKLKPKSELRITLESDKLEVGDSILVKDKTNNSCYSTASAVRVNTQRRFTCREIGPNQVRVWRIA